MTNPDLNTMRTRVTQRLTRMRGRLRSQLVMAGMARLLLTAVAVAAVSFLADWRFELGRPVRILLMGLCACGLVYIAIKEILLPLIADWSIFDIAGALDVRRIDAVENAISPKVATLFDRFGHVIEEDFSTQLTNVAAKRSFDALEKLDFENRLNRKHRSRSIVGVIGGLAIPLLAMLVIPYALTSVWFMRWIAASDAPWPRSTQIHVVGLDDGRVIVPKGEPRELSFQITDKKDRDIDRLRLELRFADRKPERLTIVRDAGGRFVHEIAGLRVDAELRVWAGDGRFGPIDVVPVDRPRLVEVRLMHQHPWDDGEQVHDFNRGDGSISLLPRTKAKLLLKANVPVESIDCKWSSDKAPHIERIDEQTFAADWEHETDLQAKLRLVGKEARLESQNRSVSIGLKRDRPPSITMRPEGVKRRVTPSATLPLKMVARDDFGVSQMRLTSKLERIPVIADNDNTEPPSNDDSADDPNGATDDVADLPSGQEHELYGPTSPATERLLDEEYDYALADLSLAPGDLIRLMAAAKDDCFVGVQASESPWVAFDIVKPEELFREILVRQQQLRTRLRKATDAATDLRDKLTTSQFPEAGPQASRDQKMLQREVSTIHRGLEETVREMELNELGGEEALALIKQNVLDRLGDMNSGAMENQKAALNELSKAGGGNQSEAIERQEKIVDEMKQVLKNMAQWDSFVDVVNQLDAVIKLQKVLKEDTEEIQERDIEAVFDD